MSVEAVGIGEKLTYRQGSRLRDKHHAEVNDDRIHLTLCFFNGSHLGLEGTFGQTKWRVNATNSLVEITARTVTCVLEPKEK